MLTAAPVVISAFRLLPLAALIMAGAPVAVSAPAELVAPRVMGDGEVRGQPLEPRSGPPGKTMFVRMTPDKTGILSRNDYDDPRIWAERYNEFPVGAIGTGITIGDYDGDGRPDIFVVSKTETCRLFRNLGHWKFEDVTEKAGVGDHGPAALEWKQGATFIDVNNDGLLDLYVCRFDAPNLLYMNQGDATFREEAASRGLALMDACGMAAFCDYDRDGALDVYVQTNVLDSTHRPQGQRDHLLHNDGDGHFVDVTAQAGIAGESQGHSAIWWDYDDDGWPDLYVANDFAVPDRLYHNLGNGTFVNSLNSELSCQPYHSMGSDVADVDNDGHLDLFVGEMARTSHEAEFRSIAETRSKVQEDDTAFASGAAPQLMRNVLQVNSGSGAFLEVAQIAGLAATDWTWSVRFEDLDNDGRVDLHVTNGMVREYDNVDLRARTMRAESAIERVRTMRSAATENDVNRVYRNSGDLSFEDVSALWGLDQKGVSFGAAFADLDGDGDLDLVVANYQSGPDVYRNDGAQGHQLNIELRGTSSNRFGIGATVSLETGGQRQMRQLTLARGYLSSSEPMLHFGLGVTTRVGRITVKWPSGRVQVLEDVEADQRLIVTEPTLEIRTTAQASSARNEIGSSLPLFTNASQTANFSVLSREALIDEGTQQPFLQQRFNRRGPALAIGDVNGDGRDDVVLGGTALDPLRISEAAPGAVFHSPRSVPAPDAAAQDLNDGPILLADLDDDGDEDLLVTKGGVTSIPESQGYQPALWLNDGRGHFQSAPAGSLPDFRSNTGAVAAADFDRDGQLDVFAGGRVLTGRFPLPPVSALWHNEGGGRFVDVTTTVAPELRRVGLVTSALWSDLDGDGWIDLLVATEWGGIHYFHNELGARFVDRSDEAGFSAAGTGAWTSLAAADFNRDGRLDYAAGNLGQNTRYRADAIHPRLLYYGRFADRGPPLAIEAYFEGDRLFTWLTRRQLGSRISAVQRLFPTNDAYARATLPEILGQQSLAGAQRYTETELRSGVFLSTADGRFVFHALPLRAQLSPLQGVVASDFDGDGNPDLIAVQNSRAPVYSASPSLGGIGVMLRGNGTGEFAAEPSERSGVQVKGDAKALALLDINEDSWPDFVVSRNDGTTLAFEAQPRPDASMFSVRLRQDGKNRACIGSRVTVVLSDGSMQIAETTAGSGYYSQSSDALFFGHPASNPPIRLSVRWPDGKNSEHRLRPEIHTVTIQRPSGDLEATAGPSHQR
ncbi:MAG TPA: FG-GAP-like repeat-containing protein [Opitutaceae bacterium]|nr:FG-GAP-like repeat-containing protein [Opitutaceae bacterium]